MNPEERNYMDDLCTRIVVEKNPETFNRLVRELNELLESKYPRVQPKDETLSN